MSYKLNKTDGSLLVDLVDGQLDTTSSDLTLIGRNYSGFGEVLNENFINWPIIGKWIWPNSFIGNTHDEEITYLKQWIDRRLNWLDQHMGFL